MNGPQILLTQQGAAQVVTPAAGSLVLTGATPSVLTPRTVLPAAAALVLIGSVPAVATPRLVLPSAIGLVLTGATSAVATPRVVLPGAGALVLTGAIPTVTTSITTFSYASRTRRRRTFIEPSDVRVVPVAAHLRLVGAVPPINVNDDDLVLLLAA